MFSMLQILMKNLARSRTASSLLLFIAAGFLSACGGGGGGGEDAIPDSLISLPAARGTLPAINVADDQFNETHFSGAGACETCHNDQESATVPVLVDSAGRDLSIGKAWESSTMANSARDPYWHAVVASELARFPTQSAAINDTCTRCHAPMANELARKEGFEIQIFDTGSVEDGTFVQGFLSKDNTDSTFNHAMDGVSCSLCHQIADDGNLGSMGSMTGGYTIEFSPVKEERPAYGQYTDPDVTYMQTNGEFTPTHSAHISQSETCATCHNLNTNPLDKDGNPVEGISHFAEQAMFTEWQHSDYRTGGPQEAQCQECHMPRADTPIPLATAGSNEPRADFAEHSFLAANTVMQQMMDDFRVELGIADGVDFQESIARNRQFLTTAADVTIFNTTNDGSQLFIDVEILNKTGHKLPSGYHSRRAYIHVLVTDGFGQVIYENGRLNADGSIDGVADDTNPHVFEPHHNVITDPTQVQVYQAITHDANNDLTHSLLAATGYLKDNRLTPQGFDKTAVPQDVQVAGLAVNDVNFNLGKDVLQYIVPVAERTPPFNVVVELMYQPFGYGHLQDIFKESEKIDQVDQFRTIYENTTLRAETIGADFAIVE